MTIPSQAIEVEVVEIDGAAPPARFETPEASAPRPSWQTDWQGRVRKLDSRWWPLWVLLGAVAVVLLLTVGLVLGIVFVIFRILRGIIRAIFG
jgi:sensor domain CHASE-containing protein